jgi:hypothetical protein
MVGDFPLKTESESRWCQSWCSDRLEWR